jgi:hypothetical protein
MRFRSGLVVSPKFTFRRVSEKPNRDAVGPPVATHRPAWERLGGIPLALPEMQKVCALTIDDVNVDITTTG